jgi:hypothetical protein
LSRQVPPRPLTAACRYRTQAVARRRGGGCPSECEGRARRARGKRPEFRQKQEPGACTDLASDCAEALVRAPRLGLRSGLQARAVAITAAFRQSGSLRGPPSDSCRGTIPEVQAVVGARGRDAPAAVPEQEPRPAASTLPRLLLLGGSTSPVASPRALALVPKQSCDRPRADRECESTALSPDGRVGAPGFTR